MRTNADYSALEAALKTGVPLYFECPESIYMGNAKILYTHVSHDEEGRYILVPADLTGDALSQAVKSICSRLGTTLVHTNPLRPDGLFCAVHMTLGREGALRRRGLERIKWRFAEDGSPYVLAILTKPHYPCPQ
jgi:hypothetical protein